MIIKNDILVRAEESDIINGSCTIPEGIISIGDYAFYECKKLKSITLSNSIICIGDYAFYGCKKLKSIALSDRLTITGDYVFDNCQKLIQIQWGEISYQVKCINVACMAILQTKELGTYTIHKCQYFPEMDNTIWVAEKDGITAHGTSIRDAIRDVDFKLLKNRDITEHIARIQSQGYVTPMDYRLITGACEEGTAEFLKRNHLAWDDRRTIEEVIELTAGEYGHETFVKALTDSDCIS